MKSLGICIGASTISAVGLAVTGKGECGYDPLAVLSRPHEGNPRECLAEILSEIGAESYGSVATTGRKFRNLTNLTSISEPEAVEAGLARLSPGGPEIQAVLSLGGENFLVYVLGRDRRISNVLAGNKCASGTGEFFLQQIRRLNIPLDEAMEHAAREVPFRVSGRCSVFCKSDCTHATNKGVPRQRVVAGLCRMMAGKVLEILKHLPRRDMMVIGGVSRNSVLLKHLREEIENLVVPREAPYFEALGCALWASEHETKNVSRENLFRKETDSFFYLPPLYIAGRNVEFRLAAAQGFRGGEKCILGLDVGSTTTKAALVRLDDHAVLASVYLRTNGEPVNASRQCYAEILGQSGDEEKFTIAGIGVTGSGRQIAGLHAMTGGVINEIIAHAAGAAFFDPSVDTIFEIGGQDAKYIRLTAGVPSDYAMNDACSAGTGSFLEESAQESLGIGTTEIGSIAMKGDRPPNFNDQCAAFIASDVKNAFHEGIARENVVAGLVYSICMNYLNRVKGPRPVGNTIFMQGGVCYNRAVPAAMASLTGKRIVVPPDPGLIGAFGVALEVEKRIGMGVLREGNFSLRELRDRALEYREPFTCRGGREGCDRRCEIARIAVNGKVFPFGGSCNKWYNVRAGSKIDGAGINYVARHEHDVFNAGAAQKNGRMTVGINKSFFTNGYFPLYSTFFSELGYGVVIPTEARQTGMDRKGAAFCYPAELAHGFLSDLLEKKPSILFLPHVAGSTVKDCEEATSACPVSQAEPYYLQSAFKDNAHLAALKAKGLILSPVIDLSRGLAGAEAAFQQVARSLGHSGKAACRAFAAARAEQEKLFQLDSLSGHEFLTHLENEEFGVVILGRPYNAFVSEAHMGVPQKFASRGIPVIPADNLPLQSAEDEKSMYWSAGRTMLRGARFVAGHPKLFACCISNFSCGPDSFIAGFARDAMGSKPMLLLELDSHVADAGLETRIEAFIDVIRNYLRLGASKEGKIARHFRKKTLYDPERDAVIDSEGRAYPVSDPRVHIVFPSMGDLFSEAAAAIFRGLGMRASALPPADEEALKIGRENASCKECLPLLLTTGSLLKYVRDREDRDELLVYFMTTADGPCRFGQYSVFIRKLIEKLDIRNTTLMSISAADSYTGLKDKNAVLRLWKGAVMAEVMQDVRAFLMASAADRVDALAQFRAQWARVTETMESGMEGLGPVLRSVVSGLRKIKLEKSLRETPVALVTGEIFVRNDGISRQHLVERLAAEGIASKVSGVAEWIYYTDWCYGQKLRNGIADMNKRLALLYRSYLLKKHEKAIKDIFRDSGLLHIKTENVKHVIRHAGHLVSPELKGEAILTVGAGLTEILDPVCGVVAVGPFGCMPNRIAEAILSREMNREGKEASGTLTRAMRPVLEKYEDLPFLCVESDGNAFPQIITARLEAFVLQARKFHQELSRRR